jgi:hypothetical protein
MCFRFKRSSSRDCPEDISDRQRDSLMTARTRPSGRLNGHQARVTDIHLDRKSVQNDLVPSDFAARVLAYPTLVGWLRNLRKCRHQAELESSKQRQQLRKGDE